ncbi:tellurite resistance TerB family protein [Streptomyces yaizuensis]|uniref:Tellurium resistance protein n=1 Tax=Streptomyces yaizuensis TaxID=2989713 RepID=A0ABQ5NRP8_9ACTN|nr:tellurium resistance protein [Streptomyces sp. YSPA8]GLF92844.1 tellurium resistance protein [Streptomyces sp. YSPA8]
MTTTAESSAEIGRRWIFQSYWGFGQAPSATDFDAYGKALLICAKGDGDLADEERAYAVGLIAGMHGPDDVVELLKTYSGDDEIQAVIAQTQGVQASAGCLLYDTIRVSAADGDLAPGELERIGALADALGVGRGTVDELVEIYTQEHALVQRRLGACYPDPGNRPF